MLVIIGVGYVVMEVLIMNFVEWGECILVCENGMWGKRVREIVEW